MGEADKSDSWDFTEVIQIQRTVNAEVAAETLRYAASDWQGDPKVAAWLESRADRITEASTWDREGWPGSAGE